MHHNHSIKNLSKNIERRRISSLMRPIWLVYRIMSSNPFAAYLENTVLSASPVKLVYLAYEGAIEVITVARAHLKEGRIHERSRAITRAQLFLSELQTSLDFRKGGDLSTQLGRLYEYMQRRLLEANFKQDEAPLADVQGLLETLSEAWREVAEIDHPLAAAAASSSSAGSSPWSSATETASTPAETFTYAPSGSYAYTPSEPPAYNPAPADSFTYTPSGSPAYAPVETPAYSWAGSASSYGKAESAYTHSHYTL
jgi:flagellar protein FliS